MKSFKNGYLEQLPLTHRLVQQLTTLGQFKGKQIVLSQQQPQALASLKQAAIIQSTESSNRIEGITAPLKRIKAIVLGSVDFKDRPEQEIAGYKTVLELIHQNATDIPLSCNVILQLHRDLYKYLAENGGAWKISENSITEEDASGKRIRFKTVSTFDTPRYMTELVEAYELEQQHGKVDPIILIAAFVLDFLCIHPFHDGNGRMARLLSLLLLYHTGFEVGRYISLERLIEDSKAHYYNALYESSQGWHEGKHDLMPWLNYFASIIIAAYKELESQSSNLVNARGAKTQRVIEVIDSFMGTFSISDIQETCPHASIDLIRKVLREERKKNRVVCLGTGSKAKWERTR